MLHDILICRRRKYDDFHRLSHFYFAVSGKSRTFAAELNHC